MKRSIRPCPTSPSPASLPDDDDTLAEILLRLPPHPSSLPLAGAVCKRWRRIVTDPHFLRRFRALHHRTPPLRGFFLRSGRFFPTQQPPDRLPPWHFSLDRLCREPHAHHRWSVHCVRHGLVLCGRTGEFAVGEFLVVDPMTGDRRRVAIADEHNRDVLIAAAVVGVAGGDAAGGRPFILVALFTHDRARGMTASVYSSDSGNWSESVSTVFPPSHVMTILQPSSLVGHGLYWLLSDGEIVRFDLVTHSLGIIEEQPPRPTTAVNAEEGEFIMRHWNNCMRWIMPAAAGDDGRFCLAILCMRWILPASEDDDCFCLPILSGVSIMFWEREEVAEVRGASSGWVLCRTVELDNKVLPVKLNEDHALPWGMMGFDEDKRAIFICTRQDGVFMSDVESMQFKKVSETAYFGNAHPYSSF